MKPKHSCSMYRNKGRSRLLHRSLPSLSSAHNSSSTMSRQSCDATIIHSSIALLQQRFRELERAKKMRQQRELLKLFTAAEHVKTANVCETSRLFFHPELVLPACQLLHGSLHLQPNWQTKYTCHPVNETPNLANLRFADTRFHVRNDCDESDVDTSLHL